VVIIFELHLRPCADNVHPQISQTYADGVLEAAMDFEISDVGPYIAAMWFFLAFAIAFFALAIFVTLRRRSRGIRPGGVVAVLLLLCAIAAYFAYEAYFPHPRDFWY
jgi:hypothetical protein